MNQPLQGTDCGLETGLENRRNASVSWLVGPKARYG